VPEACVLPTLALPTLNVIATYEGAEIARRNPDAAWYHPSPKDAARDMTDMVTIWKGISVRVA
jgi:uncharacterized protein (DUF427 family)